MYCNLSHISVQNLFKFFFLFFIIFLFCKLCVLSCQLDLSVQVFNSHLHGIKSLLLGQRCTSIFYLQVQKIENPLKNGISKRNLFSHHTIILHGKQKWRYFFEVEDCIGFLWPRRLSLQQPYKSPNTSIKWMRPTEPFA